MSAKNSTARRGGDLLVLQRVSIVLVSVLIILVAAFQLPSVAAVGAASPIPVRPAPTLDHQSSLVPTSSAASTGTWWVGAQSTDASALPNTGVETTVQVISQYTSGCLSFWIGESELSNGNWAQVGYYLCGSTTPLVFYQVWNLPTMTVLTAGATSVTTGTHTFSMYVTSGTTWAFALDGNVFGTYNMGSAQTSTYPIQAFSEQGYLSAPISFSQVEFLTAMKVLRGGVWQSVTTASSYGTAWGVQGEDQKGLLQSDETVVGGSLGSIAAGTALWSGGTLATDTVSITSPLSGSSVSGIVSVKTNPYSSVGVSKVQLYVDGALYATSTTSPYGFAWDTTKYSNGSHKMYTVLYDTRGGSKTSTTITLTVNNPPVDRISITSPTTGSVVWGTVTVTTSASSSVGISSVKLYVDGVLYSTSTTSPYSFSWNTSKYGGGKHTLYAVLTDRSGGSKTSASITVTLVSNSNSA